MRLTAIEARAGAALRLGRAAEAVAGLNRLAAEHPLREETWRLLALALYHPGARRCTRGAAPSAGAASRRPRRRPRPVLRELEDAFSRRLRTCRPAATCPARP